MHKVKCSVCGIEFDRDRIQAVRVSARRYAHYECKPECELVPLAEKVDPDQEKLINYVKTLLGQQYNAARVRKQIKDYIEKDKFTYSGILGSLVYWYEVKGNSIEKANGGIGIVGFIYNDARLYFAKIQNANEINDDEDILNYNIEEEYIEIESPRMISRGIKLFDFEEEYDEE